MKTQMKTQMLNYLNIAAIFLKWHIIMQIIFFLCLFEWRYWEMSEAVRIFIVLISLIATIVEKTELYKMPN